MKNPGELIRDRYKILSLIAKSKKGHIYKVLDQAENRDVALKMLEDESTSDSDVVKRVIKEGEVLAQLRHPAIVQFYSLEMEGRTPFLVMEYIEGRTMKDLKEELRKDLQRFFNLFLTLLEGVEACHQAGVFHRNLTPENLLITKDGQLKIIDFRFAKTREKLTRQGEFMGFSGYTAPEQYQGQKITEAADIYSLGVILWEFLTGELPYPMEVSNKPVDLMTLLSMANLPLPIEKFDVFPRFAGLRNLMEQILDKDAKFRPSLQEIISTLKREMPDILATAPNPA
ncbi:MAG: serine/threonine-protein kinase [Candidatus Ozemobacteraceae bacterium]